MKRKFLVVLFACFIPVFALRAVIIVNEDESFSALESLFTQSGLPLRHSMPQDDRELTGRCFSDSSSKWSVNSLSISNGREIKEKEITYKRGPLFGEEDVIETIAFSGLEHTMSSRMNSSDKPNIFLIDQKTGHYVLEEDTREQLEDMLNMEDLLLEILTKNALLLFDKEYDDRSEGSLFVRTQISVFKWIRDGGVNYLLEKRFKIEEEYSFAEMTDQQRHEEDARANIRENAAVLNSEESIYYCVYWVPESS